MPKWGKFVVWSGGKDFHLYDVRTNAWSVLAAAPNSPSPTAPAANGTYGRFRYVPSKDAFVLANSVSDDVFVFRLPDSAN